MRIFNRRRTSTAASSSTSPTVAPELSKAQLKRATRTRKIFALLTSFFLFITVLFLILVDIGGTYNRSIIRNWYFLKIDVSHIIPASVPNFALINTIAQTLGLHDFYQTLYWFNPVEILQNELLAGASINLPADINDILDLIRIVSRVMFGLFLTSTCLSFVLMFLMPISVFSRWWTLPIAILTFLNALFVTVASVIATVMFVIFRNVIGSVAEINISAKIGSYLFGFMWTASAFAIFAWLIQTGLCCCCASRRDVRTGRKKGNEKAYHTSGAADGVVMQGANGTQEKSSGRRRFRFGKRSV